jgi:predicted nucleic acid-binding protein
MAIDRIYMDSCCFIEAVKYDVGDETDPARQNAIWYIKQCLLAARSGDLEVITSNLTLAESRRADGAPTEEVKRLLKSILTSGKVVKLAQVTQSIAEKARDLHWVNQINLGGADAIHVATALTLGCKEFLTFDERRKSPLAFENELMHLGLKIITPANTKILPILYLQQEMPYKDDSVNNQTLIMPTGSNG